MRKALIFVIIILAILIGVFVYRQQFLKLFFRVQAPQGEIGVKVNDFNQLPADGLAEEKPAANIEAIVQNLQIPWEIAFLPTGEILVTERPGNLLKIDQDRTVIKIQGVEPVGEGGLQGLVLHPNFSDNQWLYLYLTVKTDRGLINRVERYKLSGDNLTEKAIILDNIPAAQYHDGGRLKFGPDNKLYVTTGDAGQSGNAQNLSSLAGKIMRLNDDGSIPADNPFKDSPIYSYGHRNPQGLAWDDQGRLWSTEHGRSGLQSGLDELNLIEPGKNYGWPEIQGDETQPGMVTSVINSGPKVTWAPAGIVYREGSLFFAGLRGEALYQYNLATREFKTHFYQDFGRLRAVTLGPDGFLYLSTSNTDGRGSVQAGDDKIIKINPEVFR